MRRICDRNNLDFLAHAIRDLDMVDILPYPIPGVAIKYRQLTCYKFEVVKSIGCIPS
jgi:hypothetical protein